jgi:hypothetical protein
VIPGLQVRPFPMKPRGHGPHRTPSAVSMQLTPGKQGGGVEEQVSFFGLPGHVSECCFVLISVLVLNGFSLFFFKWGL